jgi:hypothetical protein
MVNLRLEAIKLLLSELRYLTNPRVLKTDEEHRIDRKRAEEICAIFGQEYPEDVFELYKGM